jgi:hypothetical protein
MVAWAAAPEGAGVLHWGTEIINTSIRELLAVTGSGRISVLSAIGEGTEAALEGGLEMLVSGLLWRVRGEHHVNITSTTDVGQSRWIMEIRCEEMEYVHIHVIP